MPLLRAPRSRSALVVTLVAVAVGALIVVLAVLAVVRNVRDDAGWVALGLGVAIAVWGLWFHALLDGVGDGRPATAVTGVVATAVILGGGAYWLLRAPLDRSVAEALVVTVIVLGLWTANRLVDAATRGRRAAGDGSE